MVMVMMVMVMMVMVMMVMVMANISSKEKAGLSMFLRLEEKNVGR